MSKLRNILVIGGAGYIGSHMVQLLLDQGYDPVIFDNTPLKTRQKFNRKVKFIKGDIRDYKSIHQAIVKTRADLLMFFAGLIIAPESNIKPLEYFDNNVLGAVNVLKAMRAAKVKNIVFSSTAAVYGNPKKVPITEDSALAPINVYGQTKLMFEQMLQASALAYKDFNYIALRYFNAAGGHEKGLLGECHDPETHLIPNILKTVKGELKELTLYGDDYPTKDGTCIRDYIHVQDLAEAHYLAIKALERGVKNQAFNLGTGSGYSVKQIVNEVIKVTGKNPKIKIGPRRPGDPAKLIASPTKAHKVLGWKATRNLETIIETAWAWEK